VYSFDAVLGNLLELLDERTKEGALVSGSMTFDEGDGDDVWEMRSELGREVDVLKDERIKLSLLDAGFHH
jgi:hypothetical protein